MKNCRTLPLVTLTVLVSTNTHAEVTLDGTLSHADALPGPNYQIGADVGQQHGGNLFHSFRDFNLQSHESATFAGPNNKTFIGFIFLLIIYFIFFYIFLNFYISFLN